MSTNSSAVNPSESENVTKSHVDLLQWKRIQR